MHLKKQHAKFPDGYSEDCYWPPPGRNWSSLLKLSVYVSEIYFLIPADKLNKWLFECIWTTTLSKKPSKKNAGFSFAHSFHSPFTESICPSQILNMRPLTPESRRGIPQLHSPTTNWFLPGVPCASKYSSHPWFCVLSELFLFWFSFNKATKFRHFTKTSVHTEEVTLQRPRSSFLCPPTVNKQPFWRWSSFQASYPIFERMSYF